MEKTKDFPEDIHKPQLYPFPFVKKDELTSVYRDYFRFTICRNPWSRIVSCFKDKIRPAEYNGEGFTDGVALPLQRFEAFYGGMSFTEFVEAVCKIPDSEADHHFQSQTYQLVNSKGELLVNYIGKLETMERSLEDIHQKTGLQLRDAKRLNVTGARKSYHEFYSPALSKAIGARFSADIELLKYHFQPGLSIESIGVVNEKWPTHFYNSGLVAKTV